MEIKFAPGFKKSFDRLFSKKPWYAVPRWFKDTQWRIQKAWQRVWLGYDEEWWWAMYSKVTETLIPNLKTLKEKHIGHPGDMKDMAEYDEKLQEMIDGFEAAKRLEESWETPDADLEIFKKGMETFTKYYFHLWD